MATKSAAPPAQRSWIWPAVIAVIVVLGVVAVLASRSSSKDDDAGQATDAVQTSDVTVTGDALAPFQQTDGDPAVGTTIPEVAGTDFSGEPVSIGPDDGAQVIMVVAHWCPHCQAEVPRIVDHLADTPMPDDVALATISTSVKPDADNYPPSTWLEDEDWPAPVLADTADGQGAAALGLTGFPYFVAVDADGTVVARTSGEITTEQFDQLVAAAQGS
jgi:thiol-disulfide isomerase/thioredoxin